MIARLRVDPIACDGRALCAEMLPELITLDDWGFPIIGDDPVPRGLLGDVRVTVRACPKLALEISEYSERPAVLRPRPLRLAPDDVRLRPESPADRRCRWRPGGRGQDSEEVPGPAGEILIGRPVLAGYLGRERAARFSSGI